MHVADRTQSATFRPDFLFLIFELPHLMPGGGVSRKYPEILHVVHRQPSNHVSAIFMIFA